MLNKGLYDHKPEQLAEVKAMELKLYLNVAQGYLKMKEWTNAVTHADKALTLDSSNAKALYRKASALIQLLNYSEAAVVLEILLQAEPENAAAKSLLNEARRSAQISDRRAKKMSQKMLSVERDPRVPPTQREATMESMRATLDNYLRFLRTVPQKMLEFPALVLSEARRRWQ